MPRGPGPVARQKERIAALRQEIAELNRKGMRLTIQLEEAEAALEQMTGRRVLEPTLRLERSGR